MSYLGEAEIEDYYFQTYLVESIFMGLVSLTHVHTLIHVTLERHTIISMLTLFEANTENTFFYIIPFSHV